MARTATEINISVTDFLEKTMQSEEKGTIAEEISNEKSFQVSPAIDKLHPVFSGTSDAWMYPESYAIPDENGDFQEPASASVPADADYEYMDNEAEDPKVPLPQRPSVVVGAPEVLSLDDSPLFPIRRLRRETEDPATEAAL